MVKWKLVPQLDNDGLEVGIGGLKIGWLLAESQGKPVRWPGSENYVRCLVDMAHGQLLVHYLNGEWGKLPGHNEDLEHLERLSQPYLDMLRVPSHG